MPLARAAGLPAVGPRARCAPRRSLTPFARASGAYVAGLPRARQPLSVPPRRLVGRAGRGVSRLALGSGVPDSVSRWTMGLLDRFGRAASFEILEYPKKHEDLLSLLRNTKETG
jgi:hypothetical protein